MATKKKKSASSASKKKASARSKSTQKTAKKKVVKKTAASKAATPKKVSKKATKKKPVAKSTKKKVAKTTKKSVAKKAASTKVAKKKAVTKKATTKKAAPKKAVKKKVTKTAASTKSASSSSSSPKKSSAAKKKVVKKAKSSSATKTSKAPVKTRTMSSRGVLPAAPRVPYASLETPAQTGYDPQNHTPPTEDKLRKVKTGLGKRDLSYFQALLLERRAEIIGDVQGLEASRSGGAGEISHMPLHMADVGSDNYEQEFTLGLMESERKTIIEIDEALQRIVKGYYGVCVESGIPIGRPRLEAKPWAKYCIEVARERERRGY